MTYPERRLTLERLLGYGPCLVAVDCDARCVVVPQQFHGNPSLTPFRIGYGLVPEIHDLTIDDTGIAGTLVFSGRPFHCTFPWQAVHAINVEMGAHQGEGVVWLQPPAEQRERVAEPVVVKPEPGVRGHLRLV